MPIMQSPRSELLCGVHLLMLMFLANKAGPNSPMIPNAEFYNAAVSDSVPLEEDFIIWFQHQVCKLDLGTAATGSSIMLAYVR